ncbi:MAG: phosphatidylglycerophosphatase A, partial [Candidatus Moranbacteria bacterium]|nr:phosphatidylglycerophosphatase A [Candidatus Moranbacteria bacterium]
MNRIRNEENRLNDTKKYDIVVAKLKERGVELKDIAE